MNSPNNVQAKSLVQRLPFLCGFIFALCLIFFKNNYVFATTNINYSVPFTPEMSTYQNAVLYDNTSFGFSQIEVQLTDGSFYVNKINGSVENLNSTQIQYKWRCEPYPLTTDPIVWHYISQTTANYGTINFLDSHYSIIKNDTVYMDIGKTSIYKQPSAPSTNASVVKFIQPSNNPFLDTTDGFNFLIAYTVPPNTPVADINIKVSSPNIEIESWSITNQEHNVITGEGWVKVFATPVPIGTHTITALINGKTATTVVERLGGSVDANGDGIDDRTNQPVGDGHVKVTDPTGSGAIGALENMKDFMGSMSTFSGKIFGFFPSEIRYTMIFVISVMGFIAIKKFLL